MTLILKLNPDMVKIYQYAENEIPSCSSLKVIAWADRQIHTQKNPTKIISYPHTRVVIISKVFGTEKIL